MTAVVSNAHPLFIANNETDATMMDASSPAATTDLFSSESMTTTIPIRRPSHAKTFSWSDFPLLTEDILYVDPAFRQQRKAAIRYMQEQQSSSCKRSRREAVSADENDFFSSNNSIKSSSSVKPALKKASKTQAKTIARKRTCLRHVRFDAVHIREHAVTCGDHEWCEGTLAVTLDWPHVATPKSMLIGDYESMRQRQGRVPRGRLPKLEHWQRKHLLQRVGGMTEADIQALEKVQQGHSHLYYPGLSRTKTVPNLAAAELQHYV